MTLFNALIGHTNFKSRLRLKIIYFSFGSSYYLHSSSKHKTQSNIATILTSSDTLNLFENFFFVRSQFFFGNAGQVITKFRPLLAKFKFDVFSFRRKKFHYVLFLLLHDRFALKKYRINSI